MLSSLFFVNVGLQLLLSDTVRRLTRRRSGSGIRIKGHTNVCSHITLCSYNFLFYVIYCTKLKMLFEVSVIFLVSEVMIAEGTIRLRKTKFEDKLGVDYVDLAVQKRYS